jgi:hypothetical protein
MTAILLVIFFGLFGWIYTIKKSAGKFIVGFFVLFGIFCIYLMWSSIFILWILPIVGFAFWLWAVIDMGIKPDTFFTEYPNG